MMFLLILVAAYFFVGASIGFGMFCILSSFGDKDAKATGLLFGAFWLPLLFMKMILRR